MAISFDYYDIATGEGLTEYDAMERYNDMLDECYGNVSIAGLDYSTAAALQRCDEVSYRIGFYDWLDSELGETIVESPYIP